VQAIFIGLLASLPFTVAGIFFARDLLALMGADEWVLEHGYRYAQWMLGGNAVIMLLFVINAIYRGAGDAAIAMRVLWFANGLNIMLDPILIFGFGPVPGHGHRGRRHRDEHRPRCRRAAAARGAVPRRQAHPRGAAGSCAGTRPPRGIVRTSLGGVGQMIIGMTSWIFLMRILAAIGSEAVAGATIALRIMMFTMMPAWGMSNAAATLVGQNLGAERPDRAESPSGGRHLQHGLHAGVSVAFFLLNEPLVGDLHG
jgi:Na+-driven multidrug efflux pump